MPLTADLKSRNRAAELSETAMPVGQFSESCFSDSGPARRQSAHRGPRPPSARNAARLIRPRPATPKRDPYRRRIQKLLRARSGRLLKPTSFARTFAVPAGKEPNGTSDPTMPFTTSLIVPSPPAARIRSQPRRYCLAGQFARPIRARGGKQLDPWPASRRISSRRSRRARPALSGRRQKGCR